MAHQNVPCDWGMSRRKIVDGKCASPMRPNPDGLRERTMNIFKFTDNGGNIRGIITNYATHPVHYPGESAISGEYPARLNALLECEYYGANALFLQGAAATSRPRTTVDGDRFKSPCDYSDVNTLANALFDIIKTAIATKSWEPLKLNIGGITDTVRLDLNKKPYSYFEQNSKSNLSFVNINAILRILKNYDIMKTYVPLTTGMLRLTNDIYFCHMGGETGMEIKKLLLDLLPQIKMVYVGYTDSMPYIPTNQMISEGGYEAECFTEFEQLGPFKPKVDQKIIASFKKIYDTLSKDK